MYKLTIKNTAAKAFKKMPTPIRRRVFAELDKLAENPDRRDIDAKPLKGRAGFRLRVGDYRVLYLRDDTIRVIAVIKAGPRGGIYG